MGLISSRMELISPIRESPHLVVEQLNSTIDQVNLVTGGWKTRHGRPRLCIQAMTGSVGSKTIELGGLYNDVFVLIIAYLSHFDRIKLSQVCKNHLVRMESAGFLISKQFFASWANWSDKFDSDLQQRFYDLCMELLDYGIISKSDLSQGPRKDFSSRFTIIKADDNNLPSLDEMDPSEYLVMMLLCDELNEYKAIDKLCHYINNECKNMYCLILIHPPFMKLRRPTLKVIYTQCRVSHYRCDSIPEIYGFPALEISVACASDKSTKKFAEGSFPKLYTNLYQNFEECNKIVYW
jgi:hypothetical protein